VMGTVPWSTMMRERVRGMTRTVSFLLGPRLYEDIVGAALGLLEGWQTILGNRQLPTSGAHWGKTKLPLRSVSPRITSLPRAKLDFDVSKARIRPRACVSRRRGCRILPDNLGCCFRHAKRSGLTSDRSGSHNSEVEHFCLLPRTRISTGMRCIVTR